MECACATHNRRARGGGESRPEIGLKLRQRDTARWYVARALGEETAISADPTPNPRASRTRTASLAAASLLAVALAACGSDKPRQDASEPSGNFPVAVNSAKFATQQRLAETNDLQLEIENTGDKQVPDLAVTIFTGDEKSSGSFSVRSDQPGLADPNRPVWVLENGFPKVAKRNETGPQLDELPSGGAEAAQTDTFSFGPLDPGERRNLVWRVTPVVAGTYTVHYELAAGLNGKAKAVTDDGGRVEGEFVVTISDKPPQARVDDNGNVVTSEK